jgi:hypothetical protein
MSKYDLLTLMSQVLFIASAIDFIIKVFTAVVYHSITKKQPTITTDGTMVCIAVSCLIFRSFL